MKKADMSDSQAAPEDGVKTLAGEELAELAGRIKSWGAELGFQQVGVCDTALAEHEQRLEQWLQQGFHGAMEYMTRHGRRRSRSLGRAATQLQPLRPRHPARGSAHRWRLA